MTIDDYALISWNVVLMDSYRVPFEPEARRDAVRRVPRRAPRRIEPAVAGPAGAHRPRRLDRVRQLCPARRHGRRRRGVGARSVVTSDVEPFTIVAGNPARLVRRLTDEEMADGR